MPALALCNLLLLQPATAAESRLEQSFQLVTGWNSIHLEVEPLDGNPLTALASINWESLWTWLPAEGEPRGGRWLAIYRDQPDLPAGIESTSGTSSLFRFAGPNSYLLLARSPGTLRVTGNVRPDRQELKAGAYQLFSPSFDPTRPPSLSEYFSRPGVAEHRGSVFELAGQTFRRVLDNDLLRPGTAYWVLSSRDIPRPSPIRILSGVAGLHFDSDTAVQELVIDVGARGESVGGSASRQLNLRVIPSVGEPGDTSWLEIRGPDGTFDPIQGSKLLEILPEASIVRITLRARSAALSGPEGIDRGAAIEVSSSEGRILAPADLDVPELQGFWLGEVSLDEVDRSAASGGNFASSPALPLSLILEIPAQGPARILPCITAQTARDGRNVDVRLEAALFTEPVALSGTVSADGMSGTLSGSTTLAGDDPLNPYRHRYNPLHTSGYEVARDIKIRLGASSPTAPAENPLVTVGVIRGVYEETISGLTQDPIRVRGAFRLRRLSAANVSSCTSAAQ